MRTFLLAAILISFSLSINAQKLDDVQKNISDQKYGEAKEKIDKILSDDKGKKTANAWYYKGIVYNSLASEAGATNPLELRREAFEAFKKYQELDPKNIMMTLEQNARLFQLYEGYYNDGIKVYNLKNYDDAFQNFKSALDVKDYIFDKGYTYGDFTFTALDTQLVNLAATSAYFAKKEDESIPYFRMIADAKLKGNDYKEIYPIIVDYYDRKKDMTNRNKYLAIGAELYPENDYWLQVQLNEAGEDQAKLFAKYDELIQKNPNSFYLHYNYSVELFNSIFSAEKKPADYAQRVQKLEDLLRKTIQIKNSPETNLLMARAKYNEIFELEDEVIAIKGTKPDDVKKKQALNTEINKKYDEMYPYAQAAYDMYEAKDTLKPGESGNQKIVADILARYYTAKKQPAKAKEMQDKLKQL